MANKSLVEDGIHRIDIIASSFAKSSDSVERSLLVGVFVSHGAAFAVTEMKTLPRFAWAAGSSLKPFISRGRLLWVPTFAFDTSQQQTKKKTKHNCLLEQ
jgi:hypothetical protein